MTTLKLTSEQASLLADHAAIEVSQAMEGIDSPAEIVDALDKTAPLVALLRDLADGAETDEVETVRDLALKYRGYAHEHIGYEQEALLRLKEGDEQYANIGASLEESERITADQIERGQREARLLGDAFFAAKEICDGKSEAVAA